MYLARYPCKLQSNHRISLIGCGQGCSSITKFFGNNERLISSEILVLGELSYTEFTMYFDIHATIILIELF